MMKTRFGSKVKRHRGLHTLEMAILVPLLFTMVAVAVDFSIYLFASARFEIIAAQTVEQAAYSLDEMAIFQQLTDPSNSKWSQGQLEVLSNRTQKLIHASPGFELKQSTGLKKRVVLSYNVQIKTPFSGLYGELFKDFRKKRGQCESAEVSPFKTMTRTLILVDQVAKVEQLPALVLLWQQAFARISAWLMQVNL